MKYTFIILLALLSLTVNAQNAPSLVHRGKIKWERKTNIHAYLDAMTEGGNRTFLENAKKRADRYKLDKFEMDFNKQESVYQPEEDGISESQVRWMSRPAQENVVYNDYKNKSSVALKEVYDKKILLKDSMKKYTWKIKEEYRTIAGYNCRRAETIIMDSIWVVAFYADNIITQGGPESFNGLPGMILGVVMPRLNVTYFATEVQTYTDTRREMKAPTKGKEYSNKSFNEYLAGNLKQWGKFFEKVLWYSNI